MESRQDRNSQLLASLAEGDQSALDALVSENLGLVRKIAQRFCGRGTDYEDLVQIGVIGMIKACRSFDNSFGTAFSTYAVPLIIGEIRRHLRDDGIIKVSRTLKQLGTRLMQEREKFIAEHGRDPRISELAGICGVTLEDAAEAIEAASEVYSLSEPIGDDDSTTLEGAIADSDDMIERAVDKIAVKEALKTLDARQRQIIALRYFDYLTQQETGKRLGISQVKVSREEKKILQRLRQAIG